MDPRRNLRYYDKILGENMLSDKNNKCPKILTHSPFHYPILLPGIIVLQLLYIKFFHLYLDSALSEVS